MASSETEICNTALVLCGAERIISLEDDTERARIVKEEYPKVRDEMLYAHPWNFAVKRVALAELSETPAYKFTKYFQIPSDCSRVLEVVAGTDTIEFDWEQEGSKIATDWDTLSMKYVARITDVAKYDPGFTTALAYMLANRISYSLVQSITLKEELFNESREKLAYARSFDAQAGGTTARVYADTWLNARW